MSANYKNLESNGMITALTAVMSSMMRIKDRK